MISLGLSALLLSLVENCNFCLLVSVKSLSVVVDDMRLVANGVSLRYPTKILQSLLSAHRGNSGHLPRMLGTRPVYRPPHFTPSMLGVQQTAATGPAYPDCLVSLTLLSSSMTADRKHP